MTPNQLQDNAAALLDLYARAEEEMLRKVAKRLARGVDETGWAERKLREVQQLQTEIRRSLEHLARESGELRNALIENAFETGEAAFREEYRALGGFLHSVPESRFNAVATLTDELSERFDAAHSAILRDVDDNYRRIIGAAVSMQATGTITTRDAIKSALNAFAEKGIIGFEDRAGRHWNMDSYAEMAVRTGMMRAMREGYRQDALAHGEELVIISEHEDTCPMCIDWERAVLALTDAAANHPEAEGTLAEAEAAGLFHPNCGHSMTVYVPGLTDKSSRKRDELGYTREQDLEGYANRQQQRYMERQVRYWKRRQAVATTPEDERYAKAYVDKWQRQLQVFTGETKLPRKYDREGGKISLSAQARKIKPLQFDENGRIMKPQTSASVPIGTGGNVIDPYQDMIQQRYASADSLAQQVYDKYIPSGGAVSDGKASGGAYYSPSSDSISMNYASDAKNPRGAGTAWFHEHGHYIDKHAGNASMDLSFAQAINKDRKAIERAYKRSTKGSNIDSVRREISKDLDRRYGDKSHSIQDILGGAIGKTYPGSKWGHDEHYWKNGGPVRVCEETFAHMFEASFSPEKRALMEKYFPNSWKVFQDILGGI